ncbi:hypothetical protein [Pseudomonas sp. PDM13]|uniref:hypothetical protein n=1 Tax=Pseudomonas sp. PDM13 TaxID=2769255 RepID=UPI0021DF56B1|nr:hypothetical protein [Pseudomonas sp. PDM13]MCU9948256.1 hypothetical protein [Pseudomonas sp. PDM13]MCU9948271.1 hypothetical protein [Pseudomonas sp. PDM13]
MNLTLFVQVVSGRFVQPHQLKADCMPGWDDESGCRYTPIKWSPLAAVAQPTGVVHSLQGTALSSSERRSLEQQQAIARTFVNPVLQKQIEQTLVATQAAKESGKRERVWEVIFEARGTPCIAEYMFPTLTEEYA